MKRQIFAALLLATAAVPAAATTLSNTPNNTIVGAFGSGGASETYGQVFVAPVTGTLDSFTLWLDGGVGALRGGVGAWNGPASYGEGFGSPVNLFLSADTASTGAGPYTFAPNLNVVAGKRYFAYLTVFGVPGVTGSTTMPLGTALTGGGYFVWNNTSNPVRNVRWNYFAEFGNAQFEANFTAGAAVPEPASWALLIAGFGLVGAAARRRRRAAVAV